MEEENQEKKKPHRDRKSGRKAEKKKAKNVHTQELTDKQRNPKAFTFNSAVRAERQFRRAQDIQTKKQHVPVIDRTPLEPPPIMVVIVGPPKVGKTTLIQCLVKSFTKQPLTAIKGPVTVVSGKRRRITLIECNNDVNSMLDLAKVADLVLLLIDASFGFEMEIFEFLNICQVHGMPKVMGVLTHLDMLKNNKTLKRVKKTLKHRFWTEVYAGAKLFYLSGILHGEYLRNEIANLGRFISVMKFRPLTWQTTHSYVLADRMEDLTPPEAIRQNPKVDRSVSLYGFVRGIPLNKTSSVHIPGCGDMKIHDVCFLPDPCPLPEKLKKRSLVEKERLIYAPFSGVGGIVYDKDAVYIELAGSHSHLQNAKKNEPDRELVTSLMDTKETLDAKISKSTVKLFSDATPITASDFMAQSVSKKEPSGSDNVVSKSTSSSDNEILEHSDSERNSAEYEADTVKKRKRKSSDNDVREVASDPRSNVQKKFKKQVSSGETVKIETGKSGGFMSRKAGKEEIILSDDGRTRRKVNFVVSDEELIAENDMSGDDDDDIDDVDDDDDNDDSNSDDNTDNRNMTDEDVSPADEESDDDYDNIEAKIKYWKYDSQQSNSENNEEGLSSKKKKRISLKSSVDGKQNQNVRHHASVTKRDQEVLSKISDALTRLDNSKQKDSSRNSAGKKALSDSAWSEESFGNESDSDEFVKKQQKSDNETDDDYNSDATDDENNGSASDNDDAYDSDNEDEFNDDGCLEGDDDNSEIEKEEPNSSLRWKSDIMQKARDSFVERQSQTTNLWKLVYGNEVSVEEDNESVDEEEEVGGLFKVISRKQQEKKQLREVINAVDSSKFVSPELHDWSVDEVRDIIKDCFVTGNWKQSEDAKELLRLDDMSDDELYGDFEDLETGEKHLGKAANVKSENEDDSADETKTKESLTKAQLVEKKRKLKEKFDAEYDDKDGKDTTYYDEMKQEVTKQAELNRIQFEGLDDAVRVQLEGFRAGMYVRIELNSVPCELVTNFDPTYPIIVGGLQTGEENIGFVKVRIKKHRWYKKILKTKDPIIISLGWRRFQTLPVYSKQEDNMRYRMLKYTPEHVGCMAHFWGPLTRPNTGFLAVQDVATKQAGFRIVATGSVIDTNQSTEVTKKLKLTGVPLKIYKKTAFIRGMFTSSLEVAKFEGARIKTVSGIRGQIKKAVNKPEGAFRATFEDKIQLSDIVFCRTWYRVEVPKFYNPVTSLLLPPEEKNLWRGMKTVGQLKRESGIHSEPQLDSMYKPIEREPAVFKPLSIPRKLQKKLPYKDKPKFTTKPSRIKRVAVIRDEHESKVASVMRKIRMIYQHKQQEERQAALARLKEHRKQVEAENARKQSKEKERKKQFHRAQSKKNTKNNSF